MHQVKLLLKYISIIKKLYQSLQVFSNFYFFGSHICVYNIHSPWEYNFFVYCISLHYRYGSTLVCSNRYFDSR